MEETLDKTTLANELKNTSTTQAVAAFHSFKNTFIIEIEVYPKGIDTNN